MGGVAKNETNKQDNYVSFGETIVTYLELNYVRRIHKQQKMKIRHGTEKVSTTLLIKISYETIKTLKKKFT